jgi:hypothetical protein
VLIVFKGEKTAIFWIGVVAFSYSIYQFCLACWEIIYYYFVYPYPRSGIFDGLIAGLIPYIIGGVIFMIIGLYIMKVGTRKINP